MGRLLDEDMVINALQTTKFRNDLFVDRGYARAISIIKELPTIQHEKTQLSQEGTTKGTTSDLISRRQALNALIGAVKKVGILDADDIKAVFDMLPTIQPEQKKGRWLPDNRPCGGFWVCSCCKFPSEAFAADVLYKFCPNCGADMRGEKDG